MLFPEPVSPIMTTTEFFSTVSMIFSSNWRIGSSAIVEIQGRLELQSEDEEEELGEGFLRKL